MGYADEVTEILALGRRRPAKQKSNPRAASQIPLP